MTELVKSFWSNEAVKHGSAPLATAPDNIYRKREIADVCEALAGAKRVLDVGCGNGYSTAAYAKALPSASFIGIDFSPEMIGMAKLEPRCEYYVYDILSLTPEAFGAFDCVTSTRCLINLS